MSPWCSYGYDNDDDDDNMTILMMILLTVQVFLSPSTIPYGVLEVSLICIWFLPKNSFTCI